MISHLRDHIDFIHGPPLQVISDCLRAFLVASPGHDFISGDFSAIEARVVAWLAGEESVLEIFRGHGKIYEAAAAKIYGVPINEVTKEQRQIGKVAVLALGFGGGVGAFQMMAKTLGVKITDEEAEKIKVRWRAANPKIVEFWKKIEQAAKNAIRNPGRVVRVETDSGTLLAFRQSGSFLWCQLPSKRVLCYPYPKLQEREIKEGWRAEQISYMGVDSLTKKWERQWTYGGSLTENIVQAVARDVMADAMRRLEAKAYPVILTVHDEIVCVISSARVSYDFKELMEAVPTWATGLPIKADCWRGRRYRKG